MGYKVRVGSPAPGRTPHYHNPPSAHANCSVECVDIASRTPICVYIYYMDHCRQIPRLLYWFGSERFFPPTPSLPRNHRRSASEAAAVQPSAAPSSDRGAGGRLSTAPLTRLADDLKLEPIIYHIIIHEETSLYCYYYYYNGTKTTMVNGIF